MSVSSGQYSDDLNVDPKRCRGTSERKVIGAGSLCLQAAAIREVFTSMHLDVPITIIRTDGSQMSETFAAERPVETLLCGPAASVTGACNPVRHPRAPSWSTWAARRPMSPLSKTAS